MPKAIKNKLSRNLFVLYLVLVFTTIASLIGPLYTNRAHSITTETSTGTLTTGKVYAAGFSLYYPSGPTTKDDRGRENSPLSPTCSAQSGIPYGTKIRIFGTGTDKDGKICVVNRNFTPSQSQTLNNITLEFITSSLSSVSSWGTTTGRATIVELGDGQTLDFTDNREYSNDDPSVTGAIDQSNDLAQSGNDELREDFYIKNDIYYYKPECIMLKEEDDMIGPDSTIEERAERALKFLTDVGFTLNQAAGIVANLMAESKIMPACLEGGGNECCYKNFYNDKYPDKFNCNGGEGFDPFDLKDSQGFGIMQFTGSGETEVVKKVAEVREKDPLSMSVQLEAMMISLFKNKEGCFTGPKQIVNNKPNVGLHKVSDATDACFTFVDCYGIPRSGNCGYGRMGKNPEYQRCWSDVVRKVGQECLPLDDPSRCKYNEGFVGDSSGGTCCKVTAAIAEAIYLNTKNNRCYQASRLVDAYRGTISDGEGLDLDYYKRISSDFMNDLDTTGFEEAANAASQEMVPCSEGAGSANLNALQNLVAKSAWPLYCSAGQERGDQASGLYCNAKKPTDFYAELISCRQQRGGSSCKKPGGHTGGNNGQDCGGFVATMINESGWDMNYTNARHLGTPKLDWEMVFDVNQVDTSKLLPGDIGTIPGHVILFIGNVPGFEYPIASASFPSEDGHPVEKGRFPSASKTISKAHEYKWWRKRGGTSQ